MAQIPIGNFGQTVAQPQRPQRVFGEQAGTITGRATADTGQTAQQIGLQQIDQSTKQGVEAYNREAQTTAARVRITKQNDLDEAADNLASDIKSGRVAKDKANDEWQARRASVLDGAFDNLDERYRGPVQAELEGAAQRKSRVVRDAVTVRDQEDTHANILTLGEEYQRRAVKDRPGAVAEYETLIDSMGPAAGWGPDQIAKAKQGFRENTAYTQAFSLVRGSSGSVADVRKARNALAGDAFADVDPQRRAALDAQLDGYETNLLQRQAIAEQRAAARSEAHMNRARAAFEASQARTDAGIPDSNDQVAITTQALSGTPFLDTYRALQQRAREVGGAGAQPIAVQQAQLDQVNAQIAQQGASDALIKRRDSLQRVLEASKRDYGDDALRAGLQRGVIDALPPIDISSVDAATRTIGARLQAAQIVQTRAGRPVSPLTNDEAETLASTISALPVQQRATALATLGRSIGPQAASGLAAQIDKKDKALALALQFGTSSTTEGRTTAEIILRGQQALKDKAIKPDTAAADGWKAQIAKEIDGAYSNQKQADDVKEAAYLILSGLQSEGGGNVRQAVGLAARGKIVEHNGKRIPLPAGVTADDLDTKLRSLTPQNFSGQAPGGEVRIGGQSVPLSAFVQSLPDAQLIHAGYGRYNVLNGGRIVTNAQGRPITINAN